MSIILHPLMSEKAVQMIERENKIIFIVDKRATKPEIKREIERLYGVKVERVTTAIDPKGRKKAYVKLSKETPATELATKLNMI